MNGMTVSIKADVDFDDVDRVWSGELESPDGRYQIDDPSLGVVVEKLHAWGKSRGQLVTITVYAGAWMRV